MIAIKKTIVIGSLLVFCGGICSAVTSVATTLPSVATTLPSTAIPSANLPLVKTQLDEFQRRCSLLTITTPKATFDTLMADFTKQQVDPALEGATPIDILDLIKTTVDFFISKLAWLNNNLRMVPGEDEKRTALSNHFRTLLLSSTLIGQQIDAQKKTLAPSITTPVPAAAATVQPATVAAASVVAPTAAQPVSALKTRLQEVSKQKTLLEKIANASQLLSLVTAATLQPDKDSFIQLLSDFFFNHWTMNKIELTRLMALFIAANKHEFLFALNQKPVVDQWIKTLDIVYPLADDNAQLIVSIKNKINTHQADYAKAIQAAIYAAELVTTKLPPAELDRKNANGLLAVVRLRVPEMFNKRANRPREQLEALLELIKNMSKRPLVADVIGATWVGTLTLLVAITKASQQTTKLAQIMELQSVVKILKAPIDRYEKGLLVDQLAALFLSRGERAVKELDEFKKLLDALTAKDGQASKVFDVTQLVTFEKWKVIVDGLLTILYVRDKSWQEKVSSIGKILSNIARTESESEKKLLIEVLTEIFAYRGTMKDIDIEQVKRFFESVKKTSGLLASNQIAVLELWVKELATAKDYVVGSKIYLDGLLDSARTTLDIAKALKALELFIGEVKPESRDALFSCLKAFFDARKTFDPTKLQLLFDKVEKKMIKKTRLTETSLIAALTDEQRRLFNAWMQTIDDETKIVVKN